MSLFFKILVIFGGLGPLGIVFARSSQHKSYFPGEQLNDQLELKPLSILNKSFRVLSDSIINHLFILYVLDSTNISTGGRFFTLEQALERANRL